MSQSPNSTPIRGPISAPIDKQAIGEWLVGKDQVTILEVALGALVMDRARIGTADQRRIAAALERLGWERGKRTMHGQKWVPGPAATKAPAA